jgi:hypothetical protein
VPQRRGEGVENAQRVRAREFRASARRFRDLSYGIRVFAILFRVFDFRCAEKKKKENVGDMRKDEKSEL